MKKSNPAPKRIVPNKRKPKEASEILGSLVKAYHIEKKIEQYDAFPHWGEIVGEKLAEVSKPEKIIRGKILLVKVKDAVWNQELSLLKQSFLDKIQQLGIGAYIEDIRFITGDPNSNK